MCVDCAGERRPVDIVPREDGLYDCVYHPQSEGKAKVEVRYANQHVPGSPFHTRVSPGHDASKVKVSGDGVQPTGVMASMPVSFVIDTRDAGLADLDVVIQVRHHAVFSLLKVHRVVWSISAVL